MLGVLKLDNAIRYYAWGSTSALARLQGRPPAEQPEAELWLGGHPQAPSAVTVAGRRVSLDRLVAERPAETLGPVAQRFGAVLPFLLKVLAVAEPLSIQAHPTLSQAAAGFAREEAAGIAAAAPQRSYRDRNHKPEVVVALEPYELLCGFRLTRTLRTVWPPSACRHCKLPSLHWARDREPARSARWWRKRYAWTPASVRIWLPGHRPCDQSAPGEHSDRARLCCGGRLRRRCGFGPRRHPGCRRGTVGASAGRAIPE